MQVISQSAVSGNTVSNIQSAYFKTHQLPSNLIYRLHPLHAPSSQQLQNVKKSDGHSQQSARTNCLLQKKDYSIHLVNTLKQRMKANTLIKRMYASRGYQTEQASVFSDRLNQYTFEARKSKQLIGTMTLTVDTGDGLLADTLYKTELDKFRQQGHQLCEISKLAFNSKTSSKEIFASLFHIAYIFAHRINGANDAFIEINPRHAAFYKRMLGFEQIGEQRTCPRVNAPAVLLKLDIRYMGSQILSVSESKRHKERTIYPYFFSSQKEQEIFQIIKREEISNTYTYEQTSR